MAGARARRPAATAWSLLIAIPFAPLLGRHKDLFNQVPTGHVPKYYVIYGIAVSAITAVTEETLVSGYLLTRLEQLGWNPRWALVLSLALRTSYHVYYGLGFLLTIPLGYFADPVLPEAPAADAADRRALPLRRGADHDQRAGRLSTRAGRPISAERERRPAGGCAAARLGGGSGARRGPLGAGGGPARGGRAAADDRLTEPGGRPGPSALTLSRRFLCP